MQKFWEGKFNNGFMTSATLYAIEFAVITVLLLIARKLAFAALARWAGKTETKADDFIIDSIKYPSVFWVFATAIYITIATSDLPPRFVNYGLKTLYVLITLSITLAAANIASKLVQSAIEKSSPGVAVTGLSRAVIRVVILAIGLLITLNGMGWGRNLLITACFIL